MGTTHILGINQFHYGKTLLQEQMYQITPKSAFLLLLKSSTHIPVFVLQQNHHFHIHYSMRLDI